MQIFLYMLNEKKEKYFFHPKKSLTCCSRERERPTSKVEWIGFKNSNVITKIDRNRKLEKKVVGSKRTTWEGERESERMHKNIINEENCESEKFRNVF